MDSCWKKRGNFTCFIDYMVILGVLLWLFVVVMLSRKVWI